MSTNDDLPPLHAPPSWHLPDELVKYSPAQMQAYAPRSRCGRARTLQAIRGVKDKSGVNYDGNSWQMRATSSDFIEALDALAAAPLPKEQT